MAFRWRWLALISLVVCLFFWKIAFTRQFSLLTGYEGANQSYAWDNFAAVALHKGSLPLWDPFAHSGHSFPREMQTALFYPPKLILYYWPLNRQQLFSPALFHEFFLLTHIAAAWFMFLLARETGLRRFPAFLAAIVFSLGGFVGRIPWPNMLDSAMWLPLELLLAHRALRAESLRRALAFAAGAGVMLGLAILAGSLHVVMMQGLAVVGFVAYRARSRRGLLVMALFCVMAAGAGAVQLLPSIEYGPLSLRYLGGTALPGTEKIPYEVLRDGFTPRSIMAFFAGLPFPGTSIGTGEVSPYIGLLPLILAMMGVWRNWHLPWVRYFTLLAALAFYYTLGAYSLLHGILYAAVPFLWMAREAGRFIYLTHFGLAMLAGFGAQSLFYRQRDAGALARPIRILGWVAAGLTALMAVPTLFGKPESGEWTYVAFLQVLCAYGILQAVAKGWRSSGARFVLVALILADLSTVNWIAYDYREEQQKGQNHLQILFQAAPMARFLLSQPGLFRVHFDADWAPDIGDVYGVQTTSGKSATELIGYAEFLLHQPGALDLLNVRYIIRPRSAPQGGYVYQDAFWRVYENPTSKPRAWMMNGDADIHWTKYSYDRQELHVRTATPGTLVLSEIDYPGWRASVNGGAATIRRMDGLLRGIEVPAGESQVEFQYAPRSILAGAAITILSLLAGFGGLLLVRPARKPRTPRQEIRSPSLANKLG
jgi:hypothetical protein